MNSNSFTLITGASEGLGKALAIVCAKRNMNLVLVALPGNELDALSAFIKKNFCVEVYSLGVDLTNENACTEIASWVNKNNISINILLNNAGIGSTGAFDKISASFYKKQIQLNVLALTELTRLLIDNLKQHETSYIMNTASLAGFFSIPYKDVYAATKAFIISFSKALACELAIDNVYVSVLCPGGMNSNLIAFARNKHHGWFAGKTIMEPEDVAAIAIAGMLSKKRVIIPGMASKFLLMIDKVIPEYLKNLLLQNSFKKEYQLNTNTKNTISTMSRVGALI